MPRLPRLHVPGGCYHVVLRGNHQEDLFDCTADRWSLEEIVAEALDYHDARLHAYCWMTNHLHMLAQIGIAPLGKLIQRIAMRYSRRRHREMKTTGHLFERRHHAWLVDADEYFVALLRYIHLNPVSAGIVQAPEDYPWSSHRAYLGEQDVPWLTTEFGLSLLGKSVAAAHDAYRTLLQQPLSASEKQLFSNVHPNDARILGSDRFVSSLPIAIPTRRSLLTLEEVVQQACQSNGVCADQLKSPSRAHALTRVRVEIASRALEGRVASLNEVARVLGRNPSSLCELLARHRSGEAQ